MLANNDAPVMKYTKAFLLSSLSGLVTSWLYYSVKGLALNSALSNHMGNLQGSSYDVFQPLKSLRSSIGKMPVKFAIVFGTAAVVYKFVVETLQ